MVEGFRYIQNNLLKSEKLIYAVRPHWVIFSWSTWLLIFSFYMLLFAPEVFNGMWVSDSLPLRTLLSILLFLLSGYSFIQAFIYYQCSEYGVTDKRVLIKIGWIRRRSLEIMLEKVEGVLVDQTILGRIFNYGRITIIGTGGTQDSFPYIPFPLEFRKQVQQQIDNHERQFRVPTA